MSGRHRKPTNSSISFAKLAVTGAVIGSGSVGLAAQAQAASDDEWDTVAACESSGNWSINTGNGYQGGLQFSPSTWLGYGGGEFASAAHMASRDEQIAIAEKVLAGQGRGAWPTCGTGLSGPTPRTVTATYEESDEAMAPQATAADNVVDAAAPAVPLDNPLPVIPLVPQEVPVPAVAPAAVPAPAAPAPQGAPVPAAPAPALAPAPEGAPVPAAPAPGDPAPAAPAPAPALTPELLPLAPQPQIISIGNATAGQGPTIMQASMSAAPAPEGVPHLPSPSSPPPGTSTEPVGTSNPNVSYLKELWQAVQNNEIDKNELLLALAQRSFTGPIPVDAPVPAPAPAG